MIIVHIFFSESENSIEGKLSLLEAMEGHELNQTLLHIEGDEVSPLAPVNRLTSQLGFMDRKKLSINNRLNYKSWYYVGKRGSYHIFSDGPEFLTNK